MARIRAIITIIRLFFKETSFKIKLGFFHFIYLLGNKVIAFGWSMVTYGVQHAINNGVSLIPAEDRNDRDVVDRFDRS